VHDERARARFLREARSAATLRGAHVVQIFDYGVHDGTPYIAMELLHGESLARRLLRVGKLDAAQTLELVTHVGRAVGKAHEAGVIHRDLKPDNIFMVASDDGELAKVLDFGIAKAAKTGGLAETTETGAMLGTPYYMSPEQLRDAGEVDQRSDLWSIGVIAYECLIGARPFVAESMGGLVFKVMGEPAPVPSQHATVPKGFDAWFAKATARDPAQRFQHARELVDALASALGLERETMSTASSTAVPSSQRSRGTGIVVVAALVAAAIAIAFVWPREAEPEPAPLPVAAPPREAPQQAPPKVEPPKVEPPKVEAPQPEVPQIDPPKAEEPKLPRPKKDKSGRTTKQQQQQAETKSDAKAGKPEELEF
jgi:serine/threonine-protein kinase